MVTESGTVRLIGFAIDARLRGDDLRNGNYPGADDVTADLFDLVGLLYAGLVGRWPGASSSAVPAAPRDAHGPLRPRQVRAGVPASAGRDLRPGARAPRPRPDGAPAGRRADRVHRRAGHRRPRCGHLPARRRWCRLVLADPVDDTSTNCRTRGTRKTGTRSRRPRWPARCSVPPVAATEQPEPDQVPDDFAPEDVAVDDEARAGAHRSSSRHRRARATDEAGSARRPGGDAGRGAGVRGAAHRRRRHRLAPSPRRRATPTTAAAGTGRRAAAVRPRGHAPYAQGRRRRGPRRHDWATDGAGTWTGSTPSHDAPNESTGPDLAASAKTPTSSPTTGRSAPAATGCAPR